MTPKEALKEALFRGDVAAMREAFALGADMNANPNNWSEFFEAAQNGKREILETCMPHAAQEAIDKALYFAAEKGCDDSVYFLLNNGANLHYLEDEAL